MTHAMDAVYPDPHHVPAKRIWRVVVGVLLVHLALVWVAQAQLNALPMTDDAGQIVMATVIAEMPQVAPPSKPEPKPTPRPEPKRPQPVTPQPQPVAVNNSAASPEVAAAPPPSSAATAAAPAKTGTPSVMLPSADADYLNNPSPHYPRMSRRLNEQGTVMLRVFIGLQGTAEKVEIHTSSGYPRLDQAAFEAVQRWRFVPGKRNGTPEAMWFNVPVRFVLE